MASISSLSGSSSSSSIYGNRTYNIISGLASGLDTESLISGAIQGYQQKIQSLQQETTMLQWQQEAYQGISDKLVEFYRNYASFAYSSGTNLASSSFFSSAVNTATNGTYKDLVTASGKSDSTVVLNAVSQLATATRYTTNANTLNPNGSSGKVMTATDAVNLTGEMQLSTMSGSLTINYGNRDVTIDFSDTELYGDDNGNLDYDALKSAIVEKLSEQTISTSSGTSVSADTLINVTVDKTTGGISFSDKSSGGNTVTVGAATGDLANMIEGEGEDSGSIVFTDQKVVKDTNVAEYLSGKTITVTLDGTTKTIELPSIKDGSSDVKTTNETFLSDLNEELKTAFGSDKITASFTEVTGENNEVKYKLTFSTPQDGSTMSVSSSDDGVSKALGFEGGMTSYLDTTKTLGDLNLSGLDLSTGEILMGVGQAHAQKDENGNITGYVDDEGNVVNEHNQRLGKDGELLQGFDLVINGEKIGTYHRDTELNTIINNINANTEAGVNVSYSKITGQFVFTAKDTGAGGRVEISQTIPVEGGEPKQNLGAALFGTVDPSSISENDPNYTKGTDAKFIATINGQAMELTRSSNSFDIDGMQITVSGTFNKDAKVSETSNKVVVEVPNSENPNQLDEVEVTDTVTFTSKTDADKIVDAVKKMVEDFNTLIKEVKSAYSDMPLQQTDGSSYKPLTDEDMADMSESAIEAYEEKAKTGILFMDNDLSSLYNDLRSAITSSGADGVTLRSIGLETAYSDGLTTLVFDEQKFREALESDPDKVQEIFTKSKENGAATNGLMASITAVTEKYASTSGDVKGILIEKAGSQYSPTAALDNDILNQMEEIEEEITKWQDKMSNQVDYYTNKFTQLELLINQMNSQSSALAGLMGG